MKMIQVGLVGLGLLVSSAVIPNDASAANCNFNRNEKIAMVSWIIPIAGAVITPMACRRDMFNKKNQGAALRPDEKRRRPEPAYVDRRRPNTL